MRGLRSSSRGEHENVEFSTKDLFDETKIRKADHNRLIYSIFFPLKVVFAWMFPLVVRGNRKNLELQDLNMLSPHNRVEPNENKFDKYWKLFSQWGKFRLISTLVACYWWKIIFGGFLMILRAITLLCSTLFMRYFLELLLPRLTPSIYASIQESRNILPPELRPPLGYEDTAYRKNDWEIWLYFLGFIGCRVLTVLLFQNAFHFLTTIGLRISAVLTSKIFQKSLVLSNKERENYVNGKIVNYISTDVNKIAITFELINDGWASMIILVVSIYFLYSMLQWSTFVGFGVVFVLSPFFIVFFIVLIRLRSKMVKESDERMKKINEIFTGIRIIKFFTWEKAYIEKVFKIREKEVKYNRYITLFLSSLMAVLIFIPFLIGLVAFGSLFLRNGYLDPVIVFTSLAFFNLLRHPVIWIPGFVVGCLEASISINRVQDFLEADELNVPKPGDNESTPIIIKNASFVWEAQKREHSEEDKSKEEGWKPKKKKGRVKEVIKEFFKKKTEKELEEEKNNKKYGKIENISLKVGKGDLIMVVGSVGSGKSSLLSSILGEMKKTTGDIEITGKICYCPQIGWIKNDTLKDNIIFGKDMNEELFSKVIDMCALKDDLKVLKGGRNIEIGEKGINLSGGQKARVALARACYFDGDIFLLDDPLSSVDAHVGRHIFENCILNHLKARNKTVVLCTHQLQYLSQSDYVVLMDKGKILEQGKYQDLMKNEESGRLFKLVSQFYVNQRGKIQDSKVRKNEIQKDLKENNEGLMQREEKHTGFMSFKVIFGYFKRMKIGWAIIGLMLMILGQIFLSANQWYLSEFTNKTFEKQYSNVVETFYYLNQTDNTTHWLNTSTFNSICPSKSMINNKSFNCFSKMIQITWIENYSNGTLLKNGITKEWSMGIYVIILIAMLVAQFVRDFVFQNLCISSSAVLFKNSFLRVIKAPSWWFDTTPLGRILSRFSTDVQSNDQILSRALSFFISLLLGSIGSLLLIGYTTRGVFVVFIIPVGLIYVFLYFIYRKTSIQLKRINSISRSPVYSHVSETLNGLSVIRAYKLQESFVLENKRKINISKRSYFLMRASVRWISTYLNILSSSIIGIVSAICIILSYYAPSNWNVSLSYCALSISTALEIVMFLGSTIRSGTNIEVLFNGIERMDYYSSNAIPNEGKKGALEPPRKWPKDGRIRFKNFSMRYRESLPLVLKDISFSVNRFERLGIVGRTGSGKSSLLLAIFRMVEATEGSIEIDDVDISKISLNSLRKKLSIINQDPILFSGTMKSNLDPFNKYSDNEIWDALEKSSLKQKITQTNEGLDFVVHEGGGNFSAGERQLICLARAILKKSRFLILDECTSSVDMRTDKVLQKTIRDHFKECTILTIAHRINTIIDYDRILVLDDGNVGEIGTPKELLCNDEFTLFKRLVKESGKQNEEYLRSFVMNKGEMVEVELKENQKKESTIDDDLESLHNNLKDIVFLLQKK